MSFLTVIIAWGIFSESFFSLVSAIGILVCKPYRSLFQCLYLAMIAIWLFFAGCGLVGIDKYFPFSIYNTGLFFYSIAIPSFYFEDLGSRKLLHPVKWYNFLHVIIPLIFLIYAILDSKLYGKTFSSYTYFKFYYHPPGNFFFSNIAYFLFGSFLLEMGLLLYRTIHVYYKNPAIPKSSSFIVLISVFCNIAQALLWIIDRFFSLGLLWFLYLLSGSFIIVAFFVILKNLNFLPSLKHLNVRKMVIQIKGSSDLNTTLKNINEDKIKQKLEELIVLKKLYKDENLSLETLAAFIDLSGHQLSEFINVHYGKNFTSFINYYRVEEAKRLLTDDKEKLVVDVGFEVGFNSSSSFYRVFKKETGVSPSFYRKDTFKITKFQ